VIGIDLGQVLEDEGKDALRVALARYHLLLFRG
jgi:hypothetical protein